MPTWKGWTILLVHYLRQGESDGHKLPKRHHCNGSSALSAVQASCIELMVLWLALPGFWRSDTKAGLVSFQVLPSAPGFRERSRIWRCFPDSLLFWHMCLKSTSSAWFQTNKSNHQGTANPTTALGDIATEADQPYLMRHLDASGSCPTHVAPCVSISKRRKTKGLGCPDIQIARQFAVDSLLCEVNDLIF